LAKEILKEKTCWHYVYDMRTFKYKVTGERNMIRRLANQIILGFKISLLLLIPAVFIAAAIIAINL
jgi:hypothetical protein